MFRRVVGIWEESISAPRRYSIGYIVGNRQGILMYLTGVCSCMPQVAVYLQPREAEEDRHVILASSTPRAWGPSLRQS